MLTIIDEYRNRIAAMGFKPRSQEEIPAVMTAFCEGLANAKIEGLDLLAEDHAFCLLLVETEITVQAAIELALEYNRDVITRHKLAA